MTAQRKLAFTGSNAVWLQPRSRLHGAIPSNKAALPGLHATDEVVTKPLATRHKATTVQVFKHDSLHWSCPQPYGCDVLAYVRVCGLVM